MKKIVRSSAKGKGYRIVFVSDLHCGSIVGLSDTPENPIQEKLLDYWNECCHGPWHGPDLLVVCGDAIEGKGRKTYGLESTTTSMLEQVIEAASLLKMWDAKETIIVTGSGYHSEIDSEPAEAILGSRLGAIPYSGTPRTPRGEARAGAEWFLDIYKTRFHVQHYTGISGVWHYRSTPLSRDVLFARLDGSSLHAVDVVIRGHAHYYLAIDYGECLGMILPCWKAKDSYVVHKGSLGKEPSIGFVGFTVDEGGFTYERNVRQIHTREQASKIFRPHPPNIPNSCSGARKIRGAKKDNK